MSLVHGMTEYLRAQAPKPMKTMAQILEEVASDYGVPVSYIVSKNRNDRLVRIRWDAMWRMYETRYADGSRRYSQPQIAKVLGLADHTTVMHGLKRWAELGLSKGKIGV